MYPAIFSCSTCFFLLVGCAIPPYAPWKRSAGVLDRRDLPVHVSHLKGHLYLAEDYNYWKTNYVFYAHPEKIIFVNATWTLKGAERLLWKAAVLSYGEYHAVVSTSPHLSHNGGLAAFRKEGIPILMHQDNFSFMKKHWESMQNQMLQSFSSWQKQKMPLPNGLFGRKFDFLDGSVQLLCLEGHSRRKQCAVLFRKERILYVGHLLTGFPDENHKRSREDPFYRKMLTELDKLDFDWFIVGTGRPKRRHSFLKKLLSQVVVRAQKLEDYATIPTR